MTGDTRAEERDRETAAVLARDAANGVHAWVNEGRGGHEYMAAVDAIAAALAAVRAEERRDLAAKVAAGLALADELEDEADAALEKYPVTQFDVPIVRDARASANTTHYIADRIREVLSAPLTAQDEEAAAVVTNDARRDLARPQQPDNVREELAAAFMDLWREQAGDLGDPATITGAGDVAAEYADALLPVLARLEAAWRADERKKTLAPVLAVLTALVDAVSRGDEYGLPEAYRAARETLRAAAGPAPHTGQAQP